MYLIPGNSQMGFRLPLDSLPHVSESLKPKTYEVDPFAESEQLTDFHLVVKDRAIQTPDYTIPIELLTPKKARKADDDKELKSKEKHLPL